MEKKISLTVTLTVVSVLVLLLAITGLTYAYFTAGVTGNDKASSMTIDTAKVASINFTDGAVINLQNALPGASLSKTFTVATLESHTVPMNYKVYLFWKNTGITDIRYTLTTTGGTAGSLKAINTVQSDYKKDEIASGSFAASANVATHSYELNVTFPETGENQNDQQGQNFNAYLQVEFSVGGTRICYDNDHQSGYDCTPVAKTLRQSIIDDNMANGKTIQTVTSDTMFEDIEPYLLPNSDDGFSSATTDYDLSSTLTAKYYTYGTGYTFDMSTKTYTLTGVNYGKYSNIYSTLNSGKTTDIYIVSINGKYGNYAATSSNIEEIYKVKGATYNSTTSTGVLTYSDRIHNYDYSQTGLWLENRVGKTEDNKPVYFFRGAVQNNYVSFAGKMWRIVRINEDGTIKLILGGNTTTDGYGGTPIDYVGEDNEDQTTYIDYSLSTNALKRANETWYSINIENNSLYTSKVSTTMFCNDKTLTTDANGNKYFGGFSRLSGWSTDGNWTLGQPVLPQYKCPNTSDNLVYNIGALTADEVVYAGGSVKKKNALYYLYDNAQSDEDFMEGWWLLTPEKEDETPVSMYTVRGSGLPGYVEPYYTYYRYGYRPVISLKSDTLILRGDGSFGNPYVITE